MKTLNKLTPAELRKAGWEALNNKLGPAGALKFVMEYESGKGNYTELRRKIFEGKSVKDIIQDMKKEGIT